MGRINIEDSNGIYLRQRALSHAPRPETAAYTLLGNTTARSPHIKDWMK